MPLTTALDAVLPIFLLVAVGWAAATSGMLDRSIGSALAIFAARIGIPVLVFKTMLGADFSTMSPWSLWGCYFPAAALSWALGHVLILKVMHRDERTSVIAGVGSAFANSAFVGLPLVERAYGEHGVVIVALLISIHLPVMMTAATLLMERAERRGTDAAPTPYWALGGRILRNLLVNPIVVALILAGTLRLSGLPLPNLVGQTVRSIAQIAGPVALISLGMSLHAHGIRGDVGSTVIVSVVKLLVMPALVLAIALAIGLERSSIGPLVLVAGVPSGINVYLVAMQYRVGQSLASGAVVLTTLASIVTSAVWLIWLSST